MTRTRNGAAAILWVCVLAGATRAQDPTLTAPDAYRVQFENDQVRVVRVHYPAGARLPDHTHPAGTTLYVYLNDSEGILFRHSGTMKHVVTRPPVKTGSMRISTGPEEHHTAENTSATAADSLRILLKTVKNAKSRSRIPAGAFRGETVASVEFTSDAFVIQRMLIAPGQSATAEAVGAPAPSLWISVPSGETRWVDATTTETVTNHGSAPMELVRVIVR
jgi:hypothetical protein